MPGTDRPRLGVVGSCNVDLVVGAPALPRPGETVLGGDVERRPGGKGGNQAAAAARLGADVTLLAAVGEDDAGTWLLAGLDAHGVDTSRVRRASRPTGTAFITVTPDGDNQIVVSPGANAALDLAGEDVGAYDVVLAQLEVGATVANDVAARAQRLVLNVSPITALDPATLSACAVVIVNEVEAAALDVARLEHCVITMGSRGAVHLARGREVARADALAVDVVDTVGAGDVFCAAYALRYAEGAEDGDALRFATAAGSLATRAPGAQGALPTREEVAGWL